MRARAAQFRLVTLSNPIQVHPDPQQRLAFLKRIGADNLFYPDQRLKAFADREGIQAIISAPQLLEYAEKNRAFLHGFAGSGLGVGHWNQQGHRVVAQLLGADICKASSTRPAAQAELSSARNN